MSRNILIATSSFAIYSNLPLKRLETAGFSYAVNPYGRTLTSDEVVQLAGKAVGIISGVEKLNSAVLGRLTSLKAIARCGSGLDNIDQEAAGRLGIAVSSTPEAPVDSVAELTIGLILSLLRNIPQSNQSVRSGEWKKEYGSLLKGKKVGIVGFGRIGKRVADLLSAFQVDLACNDPIPSGSEKIPNKQLKELCAWSDIILVHASKSDASNGFLIGAGEIAAMKPSAYLVNCSRGNLIDEAALIRSLKAGSLAGAALDVFEREPYVGPLTEIPNVILTPHIGSYARECRAQMELEAVDNLIKSLTSNCKS